MLEYATAEQLAEGLRGRVLTPEHADYDDARSVWNGRIDRRPALIAQCTGVADVITCVDFAREHRLLLSIKGGGHHVAGTAVGDDALMIDLSPMKGITVDPEARTAHVQAGVTIGDLDHETQVFGLAAPLGDCSGVGISGLTLGGGIGFLSRAHGLTADNLLAAEVVTADGRLVRASETENADLFWAIRGGGGNFGVVTAFEFRLHKLGPEVLTAQIFHPLEDAGQVLRFYRDFMADAPDEVTSFAVLLRVPPAPPFPEEYHGKAAVSLFACYSGPAEDGKAALEPLSEFGNPIVNMIVPMEYTVLQQSFDPATPSGARYYWSSDYLHKLSDEAIDTIVSCIEPFPGDLTTVALMEMGGAIKRKDASATAFPHREAGYDFNVWSGWFDPSADDQIVEWVNGFREAMAPYTTGGRNVNMISSAAAKWSRAAYGHHYERLAEIKRTWDPHNVFRVNHNIAP
ncbi:MAG: FAD-binding oxidoreductase [Sphaerobacteraceae bacterium]|nr:MAG: FAD-binding oxidoreductase [Sphaerobacteraceae bacterium]